MFTVYDTWQPITEQWADGRMKVHDGKVGFSQGAFPGGLAAPLYPTMQACARNNLRIVRQAGFPYRDFYTNAAPWRSPQFWFDETMKAVGDEWDKVARTCIDYEIADPPNFIQDADMHAFIALLSGLGHPVDGYSGGWFIDLQEKALGRPTPAWEIAGYWYADYNGRGDIVTPSKVLCLPVVGHQHTGTVNVDGVTCDISVYDDSVIPAQPQQESDDMLQTYRFPPMNGVYVVVGAKLMHLKNIETADALGYDLSKTIALPAGDARRNVLAALPVEFADMDAAEGAFNQDFIPDHPDNP